MKEISTSTIVVISIVATLFLMLANVGLWVNRSILDRENFTTQVTAVIQSEEAREAITAEVLDNALENYPAIRQIAANTFEPGIAGLFGSSTFQPIVDALVEEIHASLLSPEPREISINISGTAETIRQLVSVTNALSSQTSFKVDIPDKIVLVEAGEIPSIYNWSITMVWVGSIAGLLGIGLVVYLIWAVDRKIRPRALKILGSTLAVGGIVSLIILSNSTPTFFASIESSNTQIVAVNLYETLTDRLEKQTWTLFFIGILFLIVGVVLPKIEEEYESYQKSRKRR